MIKGSKELIRDINCNNVLQEILSCEPISRAMLSKQLGLTKATISSIVQDLIQQKLVIEIGSDETQFGRKPILLSFNRKAGYAISLDLGKSVISAKLTDLKGDVSQFKRVQTPDNTAELLDCLLGLIKDLETYTRDSIFGIIGITIGIHGFTYQNNITYHSHLDLSKIDLVKEIEHFFHIPVYLESFSKLSILGEYQENTALSNFVSLSLYDNVSLGIILDKKVYTGYQGMVGNLGKMVVPTLASDSTTPKMTYLEKYISEESILNELKERLNRDSISIREFVELYQQEEPVAVELVKNFVFYLAVCLNNVITMFNPEQIILSSDLLSNCPSIVKSLEQKLSQLAPNYNRLRISELKSDAALNGGVFIAIKHFLTEYMKQYPKQQDFNILV